MKYLIVQDWHNTRGNHAGMEHMCDMLVERYPDKYVKYVSPEEYYTPVYHNRIQRKLHEIYDKYFYHRKNLNRYKRICRPMLAMLKPGDEVFLLEYLLGLFPQYELAIYLRKKYPWLKIYALSHLTPSMLSIIGFTKEKIQEWAKPIDKMLTLGSSLSKFLLECGIPQEKISTGFHYVDRDYYNISSKRQNDDIKIICIGALQRNNDLIADIVKAIPQVKWVICRGNNSNIDALYNGYDNVTLKGFITEKELKEEMAQSHISLNVMDDTIGSNVITTSMAMGLAIVVSEVGSIHDYCNEKNAVFCKNTKESFVEAISSLVNDKKKIFELGIESLRLSPKFDIVNVNKWFIDL